MRQSQLPVIEAIIYFLIGKLDKYSFIKASNTKLFNLSLEESRGNAKSKVKLSILGASAIIDYLFNILFLFIAPIFKI